MNKKYNNRDFWAKSIIMLVITICVLAILMSCKSKKTIETTTIKNEKDSIFTTINHVYKDTTIFVKGNQIELKVPVYSISETPTTIRTKDGLNLSLQRINDSILANCNQEDKIEIIKLQNKIIETYKSQIKQLEQTKQIPIKYTPTITKILAWIGGITTVSTLAYVGFRLGKLS